MVMRMPLEALRMALTAGRTCKEVNVAKWGSHLENQLNGREQMPLDVPPRRDPHFVLPPKLTFDGRAPTSARMGPSSYQEDSMRFRALALVLSLVCLLAGPRAFADKDRKSTRLNSSHVSESR